MQSIKNIEVATFACAILRTFSASATFTRELITLHHLFIYQDYFPYQIGYIPFFGLQTLCPGPFPLLPVACLNALKCLMSISRCPTFCLFYYFLPLFPWLFISPFSPVVSHVGTPFMQKSQSYRSGAGFTWSEEARVCCNWNILLMISYDFTY